MSLPIKEELLRPIAARPGNPFLNHVMQAVLRRHVPTNAPDPRQADIYYEEVRLHSPHDPVKGPYVMPLVTLRTNPCRWSVSAGCVMCGYHLGARRAAVTGDDLLAQTEDTIRRLNPSVYPALVFTSNGSFMDSREVPDEVRPRMLARLREAGFKYLIIETRPEFINEERLGTMAAAFSPDTLDSSRRHRVSVSFGLESANDFVQQYCINKGRRLSDYLNAFELLRRKRFSFDCYVLLGKPFMTEQEDVEDALKTIEFAVDHGAEYVFLMVTNLVDFSLTSYLKGRKRYNLPSLWRAVDLLERLPEGYRKAVQIKGISHAPVPPNFYAQTCDICTEHVKGSINFWNQTGEMEHIRAIHPCDCRPYRQAQGGRPEPIVLLPDRVHQEYLTLAEELDVDSKLVPSRDYLRKRWQQSG